MSETKHTPGPWEQSDNQIEHEGMLICTVTSSDDFPCIVDDEQQTEAEARASVDLECAWNARLISAAPDLLDALKGVLRVADRKTVEFDAARAAIAKATGSA